MIYDNLNNLDIYCGVSDDIRVALEYLRSIEPGIELGVYKLTPRVTVNVTEYKTKEHNELGYESHKKFIDIQYPIIGQELIRCMPIEQLTLTHAYDSAKDIMFYENIDSFHTDVRIGKGYFTILFPDDGHEPQHCVYEPELIKKITIKILVDYE